MSLDATATSWLGAREAGGHASGAEMRLVAMSTCVVYYHKFLITFLKQWEQHGRWYRHSSKKRCGRKGWQWGNSHSVMEQIISHCRFTRQIILHYLLTEWSVKIFLFFLKHVRGCKNSFPWKKDLAVISQLQEIIISKVICVTWGGSHVWLLWRLPGIMGSFPGVSSPFHVPQPPWNWNWQTMCIWKSFYLMIQIHSLVHWVESFHSCPPLNLASILFFNQSFFHLHNSYDNYKTIEWKNNKGVKCWKTFT